MLNTPYLLSSTLGLHHIYPPSHSFLTPFVIQLSQLSELFLFFSHSIVWYSKHFWLLNFLCPWELICYEIDSGSMNFYFTFWLSKDLQTRILHIKMNYVWMNKQRYWIRGIREWPLQYIYFRLFLMRYLLQWTLQIDVVFAQHYIQNKNKLEICSN